MESAYRVYIDGTGIGGSPSLEQVKLLVLDHLREGRLLRIRIPDPMLLVYDETRREWSEDIREPCPRRSAVRQAHDVGFQQSSVVLARRLNPDHARFVESAGGSTSVDADRSEL